MHTLRQRKVQHTVDELSFIVEDKDGEVWVYVQLAEHLRARQVFTLFNLLHQVVFNELYRVYQVIPLLLQQKLIGEQKHTHGEREKDDGEQRGIHPCQAVAQLTPCVFCPV